MERATLFFAGFVFGSFEFWSRVVLSSCILIGLLEFSQGIWATLALFGTLFILYSAGNFSLHAISENPWWTAFYVLVYIAMGPATAVFMWWRKVSKLGERYEDEKIRFLKDKGIRGSAISEELKDAWRKWLQNDYEFKKTKLKIDKDGIVPPDPNDYKEEIYLWITFWPWSILRFLFADFVRRLVRTIYRKIRTFLAGISERAFAGFKGDFIPPVAPQEEDSPRQRRGW